MALPPTFKIDVLTDKDYNSGQFAYFGEAKTYDDLKVLIDNNIKLQKTVDNKNAGLKLRVHTFDSASNFDFEQNDSGIFTNIFCVWANSEFINELETFINS